MNKVEIQPSAILFPTPVTIITAFDENSNPQGFLNTWIMNSSKNPPTIAIITRRERHTFKSIINKQAFGVNLINEELAEVADFFGQVSGRDIDKFKKFNLTVTKGKLLNVPIIQECPINFECKLIQQIDIADTVMLIGEVKKGYLSKDILNDNGYPNIHLMKSLLHGLTHYVSISDDIAPIGFSVK